jgi:hypothetical protein
MVCRSRSKDSFTIMDEADSAGQKDGVGKLKISSEMKEKLEVIRNYKKRGVKASQEADLKSTALD